MPTEEKWGYVEGMISRQREMAGASEGTSQRENVEIRKVDEIDINE